MKKNLITLALVLSLSACSGGSDGGDTGGGDGGTGGGTTPTNTAATFSGTSTAQIDVNSGAITNMATVSDVDAGEAIFIVQTDESTTYGLFSLSADGTWSYAVDSSNEALIALTSYETVTDSIAIESFDGTKSTIVITITGVDSEVDGGGGGTIIAGADLAVFSGDVAASIDNTRTAEVTGSVILGNTSEGEGTIKEQNIDTTYGTFSITASGDWSYLLNVANDDVTSIKYLHESLTENISISSFNDTPYSIIITISGTEAVTRSVANDTVPTINCTSTVNTLKALEDAADDALAGQTICLADGNYTGPLQLDVEAIGTVDSPVTIAAENPGNAIISGGASRIKMGGEYVVVQGFVLRDGESASTIIQFEKTTECMHCRVTEVSVIDMDGGDYGSSNWVDYKGQYNRVDHSWFSGKESRGVMLKLGRWIEDGFVYPEDHAQLDHNYFGDRAPAWGRGYAGSSDNEYEGVRMGLSTTHQDPSYSTLEYNYFERIQGEAEIISNKSANNIIRHNTIKDSNGSIVTRHGEGADISNNFIFGEDNPFSGGIRLVDGEHTVTNNYIEGARFLSSNWNGGIVLTTGDGSEDGENGYQNVENVLVAHNTIIDSVNSLNVSGGKENTQPDGVYFINNIIADAIGDVVRTNDESMPTNSTFAGNYVYGQNLADDGSDSITGMTFVDTKLAKTAEGLYRPTSVSPSLTADTASTGSFTLPTADMDGQTRSSVTTSGADEEKDEAIVSAPLTIADVGPKNYRPTPGKVYVKQVRINNHDFDSGDLTAWTSNGGIVTTENDEVFSRGKSLKFTSNDATASQAVVVTPDTNYTASAFMKGTAMLSVTVDGVTYKAERDSDSYGFDSVTFNSGSGTYAIITASVDNGLDIQSVTDADFVDFKAGGDAWTKLEGDTDGDVGTSSNTASGSDGSAKLGYTTTNHVNASPSISQTVSVEANKDFDFSFDLLVKDESEGSSVILSIVGDKTTVIADTVLDMTDMTDVGLDDYFQRYSQTINTAENTSVTITLAFNPQAIKDEAVDTGTTDLTSDSKKANELRIDNVSLISQGAPEDGTEAYFDGIRLVSHPLSEAESCYAEADGDAEDIAVCDAVYK